MRAQSSSLSISAVMSVGDDSAKAELAFISSALTAAAAAEEDSDSPEKLFAGFRAEISCTPLLTSQL